MVQIFSGLHTNRGMSPFDLPDHRYQKLQVNYEKVILCVFYIHESSIHPPTASQLYRLHSSGSSQFRFSYTRTKNSFTCPELGKCHFVFPNQQLLSFFFYISYLEYQCTNKIGMICSVSSMIIIWLISGEFSTVSPHSGRKQLIHYIFISFLLFALFQLRCLVSYTCNIVLA